MTLRLCLAEIDLTAATDWTALNDCARQIRSRRGTLLADRTAEGSTVVGSPANSAGRTGSLTGMMLLPGSFSGRISSPRPDLGPLRSRKGLWLAVVKSRLSDCEEFV
jgi:hypothetical protein